MIMASGMKGRKEMITRYGVRRDEWRIGYGRSESELIHRITDDPIYHRPLTLFHLCLLSGISAVMCEENLY